MLVSGAGSFLTNKIWFQSSFVTGLVRMLICDIIKSPAWLSASPEMTRLLVSFSLEVLEYGWDSMCSMLVLPTEILHHYQSIGGMGFCQFFNISSGLAGLQITFHIFQNTFTRFGFISSKGLGSQWDKSCGNRVTKELAAGWANHQASRRLRRVESKLAKEHVDV